MSETQTESSQVAADPDAEHSSEPFRRRLARQLSKWKWKQHKDLGVLAIGVAASGVSTVVGVAHVAWFWLLLLGSAATVVAALATRAVQARELKDRNTSLWQALAVALLVLLGIFAYHEWWDPASRQSVNPNGHQVMVGGSDTEVFEVYDQPGGSPTYEYPPLNSVEPVSLTCAVSLPGSGTWYQVYGARGWVPRDAVHAIPGTTFPALSDC